MGCANQKADESAEGKVNKEIESAIKDERKATNNKYKLLLLGTGDAGKSTFCKQMQVIHAGGFQDEESERFCEVLRDNCLTAMQSLLVASKEWGISFDSKKETTVEKVLAAHELNDEVAGWIDTLAKSKQIAQVLERASELQIPGGESGARYYFEHAKRFAASNFKPDQNDIIRAKMRTTGISEIQFKNASGQEFTMVDVGGQRSERRKWLHCFGDVTAVIFLVAINEFDMVLEEDNRTNRLEESLKLFSKLTGSQWFDNVPFILFLNKSDLFREKIGTHPMSDYFEDYEQFVSEFKSNNKADSYKDDEQYVLATEYLKAQYVRVFSGRRLFPFVTCAINKDNCEKVWNAVKNHFLNSVLANTGI